MSRDKSSELAELQSAEPEKKDRKRKKKKKQKQKHTRFENRSGRANGAWAWRDRAAAAAAAAVSRRKRCVEGWSGGDRFRLSAFGFWVFSLSLFDSLYLYSTVQKIWGFFCFVQARCTHTARGKFWIFFFFILKNKFH